MAKKQSEKLIQRGIMDYLTMISNTRRDVYWFRAGAGAVKTEAGRFFKTGRPGCPDIVCCSRGRFIGLEVKTAVGRQSMVQIEAEAAIHQAGGDYYIVRSIADVKAVIPGVSS